MCTKILRQSACRSRRWKLKHWKPYLWMILKVLNPRDFLLYDLELFFFPNNLMTTFACLKYLPEIHSSESGLNTSKRCFQITLSPQVHISACLFINILKNLYGLIDNTCSTLSRLEDISSPILSSRQNGQ